MKFGTEFTLSITAKYLEGVYFIAIDFYNKIKINNNIIIL